MTAEEALKECIVEGNVVKLPSIQLDRKSYLGVKSKLELIGGKWKSGKIQGFVFEQDPSNLLEQIQNGETRNLKKEFQFFPTPADIAHHIVSTCASNWIESGVSTLEPSAGRGALIQAIHHINPKLVVDCYELMPLNRTFLEKIPNIRILGSDFLNSQNIKNKGYGLIVANPPFANNQDIDHIMKMYEVLKPGGRIVTLTSPHWTFASGKKETAFRDWLDSLDYYHTADIDAGAFKESGTMIPTKLLVIDK